MSETSKTRCRVLPFCHGNGVDLGSGPDKVWEDAIAVDWERMPGVNWVGDVRDLPFKDMVLDYVYSSHCLEDLQDTVGALREWWRVLKVGGHLILYLPDRRWYPNIGHHLANKGHKHDFIAEDVIEAMRKVPAVFDLVREMEFPPPDGQYDYDNRGKMEYSFLLVFRKLA